MNWEVCVVLENWAKGTTFQFNYMYMYELYE